jgi:hypothetical protein
MEVSKHFIFKSFKIKDSHKLTFINLKKTKKTFKTVPVQSFYFVALFAESIQKISSDYLIIHLYLF